MLGFLFLLFQPSQVTRLAQGDLVRESNAAQHGSQIGNGSSNVHSDGNPYGDNHWVAAADPECPYHGPEHGLFDPSVPHPRYIITGGAGFIGSWYYWSNAWQHDWGQVK